MKITHKFRPTEESLEISKSFAEIAGRPFDKENVKALAENLHEVYFDEIVKKIGMEEKVSFLPGSMRKFKASAFQDDDKNSKVFLDEQLDFWLWEVSFVTSLATFESYKSKEFTRWSALFEKTLDSFLNPFLLEKVRDLYLPLHKSYEKWTLFTHDVSKAMLGFIFCHEIAHINEGHLGTDGDADLEFETDLQAFWFYQKLISYPDKSGYFALAESMMAAPVLLMKFLSVAEQYRAQKTGKIPIRKDHPDPLDRAERFYL